MQCSYCGFELDAQAEDCGRCGAAVVPDSSEHDAVEEFVDCPSCAAENNASAEYCTQCGSPMAVITRVMKLSRTREREPLETWRVYGIETRMVGRHRELGALFKAHDAMVESDTLTTVGVVGPMGLGKSRLFAEFQRQLDEQFAETYVMQAESRDEASGPYAMFERLLRNRFYIAEKEHPETARRKLVEAVETIMGTASGNAERVAHLVGELIAIEFEDSPYLPSVRDSEGATELDRKSFDALSELLTSDARRNPLVLILEDLQYATPEALELIKFLGEELADEPVLMALSWNPDEVFGKELDSVSLKRRIELKPLADKEVEAFLLDTLRRAAHVPDDFVERIIEAAHGNPLTVEEILRILISQGIVDTRTNTWKIHLDKFEDVELPKTIEGVVEARLRTLTVAERRIMGMAACIGQNFWDELVLAIYHVWRDQHSDKPSYWADPTDDGRVRDILESLERKDMIRRSDDSTSSPQQFYFKHRIEPRKVYESLGPQQRQRYHKIIAQWLLAHFHDDLERMADTIAGHFDEARCLERAAEWYLRSARYARRRYDNRRAIELFLRGLSYLSDANLEEKMLAFHDLGSLYDFLGEHDQALAYYREMLRFAWMLNDRARGGVGYNKIGRAYRSLGEYDDALEHFELALRLFRSFDDLRGIASTLDDIGKIHWIRGNFETAEDFYTAGLQLRRKNSDQRSVALSLNHLGSLKLQCGRQREAMVYFRQALEIRKNLDDREGLVDSFNNLGALLHERGETSQALTLFEAALETSREIGYRNVQGIILNNLAETHMSLGDTSLARTHLDEALQVSEESGEKRALFDILRNLGKLELRALNHSLALERVNEAMKIANQLDSDLLIGIGLKSLADVHAGTLSTVDPESERFKLAEECYKDALGLLRDVGNESAEARCLASYGKFLIKQDKVREGTRLLKEALELFERLEMRKMHQDTARTLDALPGQGPT